MSIDARNARPGSDRHMRKAGGRRSKLWRVIGLAAGGIALAALGIVSVLVYRIGSYVDPFHAEIAASGYSAKKALINGVNFSYVEGPDNGPPLLLLHAQHLDWFSYSRVLPQLAKSFHVFDVDYPGHGETTVPAAYPMTANQIGADLGDFIREKIGAPVFVSGNSSGGLLAAWLAANRPAQIKAALLEDPPLFASEYPRIRQTIANRSFATSHKAVQDHADDFLLYWIHASAPFFEKNVGPGTPFLLTEVIKTFRWLKPNQPVEIGLLHNDTVRMLVRGLDAYDSRFGAAFFDGTWNQGFDHAVALAKIACPTLLMQANTLTRQDGTLDGAMRPEDAARATSLLQHGTYVKVDASHVVNLDKPDEFVRILESFFIGK
jgi:pimeloyl-ACP methyl ester carboxylesterase